MAKPTIPDVLPLIIEHWEKPGNGVGGIFRVILSDGHHEQGHADYAYDEAVLRWHSGITSDLDEMILAAKLAEMSGTQRKKLSRMAPWYG